MGNHQDVKGSGLAWALRTLDVCSSGLVFSFVVRHGMAGFLLKEFEFGALRLWPLFYAPRVPSGCTVEGSAPLQALR